MFDWHEDDIQSFVVLETNGETVEMTWEVCPDETQIVAFSLREAADKIEAGGAIKH